MSGDWTVKDGRSNSSDKFIEIVGHVANLMRDNGGHCLDASWAASTARLIVAQLAHEYDFAPGEPCGTCRGRGFLKYEFEDRVRRPCPVCGEGNAG